MANKQQGKKRPKRKPIRTVEGLSVYGRNDVFFNEYLVEYIGARWQQVKEELYEAGYETRDVMEYRDNLLEDFMNICKRNRLRGII